MIARGDMARPAVDFSGWRTGGHLLGKAIKGERGDAFAQGGKIQTCHGGGLGQEAGLSHAGDGVNFHDIQAAVRCKQYVHAGIDLEAVIYDTPYARYGSGGGAASLDRTRKATKTTQNASTPVAPASYAGGAIVLLSDGRRTTGPDSLEAARMAADRGVRVFTVGFGSKSGTTTGMRGMSFYSVLDEDSLRGIAHITGGEYFHAGTADDLKKIYASLSAKFSLEARETEVSALFSMAAALLVIASGILSLLWFRMRA